MMRAGMMVMAMTLLLSACGFHLRSNVTLPEEMDSTLIAYRGSDASLLRTIARAMSLAGAGVARDRKAASAILELPVATTQRRVLAKDSEGRPREYEISVSLAYSLVTPDGQVLVPLQRVERRGNVALDPSQPLANDGDVRRAMESLRENAVWDMLNRIAATDIQRHRDERAPSERPPERPVGTLE